MDKVIFNREAVQCFHFVDYNFSLATGQIQLRYAFDNQLLLTEQLILPGAPFDLDTNCTVALERALQLLHLIAGISYYKAAIPEKIIINNYQIDASTAALVATIYEQGLGEFAYRNGLDLRGKVNFPITAHSITTAPMLGLAERALTAIGGGKDSLVSIQTLKNVQLSQTLTWIGNSPLIQACADHSGLPQLNIKRTLAPELFAINQQGAWNGHIPITAINSIIMVVMALVGDYGQIVFSNERSASYGSQIEGAGEVNHQWSKGWAFEKQFGEYVQHYIAADLYYYSLLRPLSELAIARQFAKTDFFDAYFSSCNRNFHILGDRPTQRWCGRCPKCHFVFLALAPFMPKSRLVNLFGQNLLDNLNLAADFDALLEFHEHKPFECVGESRESRAAMALLARQPDWQNDALIQRFSQLILPTLNPDELAVEPLLTVDEIHRIPSALWERVRANFTA